MTKKQIAKLTAYHIATAGAATIAGMPGAIAAGAISLGALAYSEKNTQKKKQADDSGSGKRGDK